MFDQNFAKKNAAQAAVSLIHDGMIVGLGTGSTAKQFIIALAKKCRNGLKIKAVASSRTSYQLAREKKIPLIDINAIESLDIGIDGADEIDPHKQLIKGGGGAALREKVVACMSKEFIVIADETKLVDYLGQFPLAVEILPFGYSYTTAELKKEGFCGRVRTTQSGDFVVTDSGNYIFDISLNYPCKSPKKTEKAIRNVVGVIETGFFLGIAKRIIVGRSNGDVQVID